MVFVEEAGEGEVQQDGRRPCCAGGAGCHWPCDSVHVSCDETSIVWCEGDDACLWEVRVDVPDIDYVQTT